MKVTDSHFAATWLLSEDSPAYTLPAELVERIERMKGKEEVAHGITSWTTVTSERFEAIL